MAGWALVGGLLGLDYILADTAEAIALWRTRLTDGTALLRALTPMERIRVTRQALREVEDTRWRLRLTIERKTKQAQPLLSLEQAMEQLAERAHPTRPGDASDAATAGRARRRRDRERTTTRPRRARAHAAAFATPRRPRAPAPMPATRTLTLHTTLTADQAYHIHTALCHVVNHVFDRADDELVTPAEDALVEFGERLRAANDQAGFPPLPVF